MSAAALKAKLAGGQPVLVVNIDHSSASLVEVLGQAGADAVFIDCEQGPTGIAEIEDLVRAARLSGTAALLRLAVPQDWAIERYLARGIDGLVIPRVDDAATFARVVDAVRYCLPHSHGEKAIVAQIETSAAAKAIDAILRVEGLDAFFIGPVDLAKSMGHAGDYRAPAVVAEMERLLDRIHAAGRPSGILVDAASVGAWARRGVQFLYCHANDFLRLGVARFRQQLVR